MVFALHEVRTAQDMPSQYFALLNIVSAPEECDATKDE